MQSSRHAHTFLQVGLARRDTHLGFCVSVVMEATTLLLEVRFSVGTATPVVDALTNAMSPEALFTPDEVQRPRSCCCRTVWNFSVLLVHNPVDSGHSPRPFIYTTAVAAKPYDAISPDHVIRLRSWGPP